MKVLIACEESQEVCKAFRARGHEAYSCDIQEPSGGHPEWHILGDALKAIKGGQVMTMDGLNRYVKKKTKARSMAKAEADPFAELEGWESMEQIQDAYGYGEITADRRDKLTDLWEAREAARNSRKGADKYHDLVTEMLETAIRRVGNEYVDMLFEYDQQRRKAEKQCEQLAMEGMMKK